MPNWRVKNGMVRPDEAVGLLTRFVAWCAAHEGHTPVRVVSVDAWKEPNKAGAIACDQCKAVFILLLPEEP